MSWNLNELIEYIRVHTGDAISHIERVDSLDRTLDVFMYHYDEALSAIKRIEPKSEMDAVRLVLTPKALKEDVSKEKMVIQANTLAAIYNVRAANDIFAQLINGLVLPEKLSIDRCDINKVFEAIDNSNLKSQLSNLLISDNYTYISDFVNTIKHRNLILFGAEVSFKTGESGVKFKGFEYKERRHEQRWALDVLEMTMDIKCLIADAGIELNKLRLVKSQIRG